MSEEEDAFFTPTAANTSTSSLGSVKSSHWDAPIEEERAFFAALNGLQVIVREEYVAAEPASDAMASADDRRLAVLAKVEREVERQMMALNPEEDDEDEDVGRNSGWPAFVYPNLTSWKNVVYSRREGLRPLPPHLEPRWTETALHRTLSARKYSLIMLVLMEIWLLVKEDKFATKRDLYYRYYFCSIYSGPAPLLVLSIATSMSLPRSRNWTPLPTSSRPCWPSLVFTCASWPRPRGSWRGTSPSQTLTEPR